MGPIAYGKQRATRGIHNPITPSSPHTHNQRSPDSTRQSLRLNHKLDTSLRQQVLAREATADLLLEDPHSSKSSQPTLSTSLLTCQSSPPSDVSRTTALHSYLSRQYCADTLLRRRGKSTPNYTSLFHPFLACTSQFFPYHNPIKRIREVHHQTKPSPPPKAKQSNNPDPGHKIPSTPSSSVPTSPYLQSFSLAHLFSVNSRTISLCPVTRCRSCGVAVFLVGCTFVRDV
jgi:hypothetical protein